MDLFKIEKVRWKLTIIAIKGSGKSLLRSKHILGDEAYGACKGNM